MLYVVMSSDLEEAMELGSPLVALFQSLQRLVVGVDVLRVDLDHVVRAIGPDRADQLLRVPVLDYAAQLLKNVLVHGNKRRDFVENPVDLSATQDRIGLISFQALLEWIAVDLGRQSGIVEARSHLRS